jgi:protoporphyrin/coproporphyrin ferrochelatase
VAATPAPFEIVLGSFGAPESVPEVEGYLRRLFSDRRILSMPGWIRRRLAARIARKRAPKVAWKYEAMGGGSPLNETTRAQALALDAALRDRGVAAAVRPAFLYVDPTITAALDELATEDVATERIIVLPLFPQYSFAGAGSVEDQCAGHAVRRVVDFHVHPSFVAWHAKRVMERLQDVGREGALVQFVAHSIPERFVRKGDPYVAQIQAGAAAIAEAVNADSAERAVPYRIAYQSRIGPVRWVGPSIEEASAALPSDLSQIIVVPISFVGEHLETRIDLDREFRELVEGARPGVGFFRTPSPTLEADWIQLLADLVEEAL